jgi:hypothetical protein
VVATVLWVAVGVLASHLLTRRVLHAKTLPPAVHASAGRSLPRPLPPEDYEKQRAFYIDLYLASIREYDRLVTAGAGGALLLSMTVVEKLAQSPPVHGVLLVISWCALVAALAASLGAQYASSRVHSHRRAALDVANAEAPKLEEWWDQERACQRASAWTRRLTAYSGILLAVGIACLTAFSLFNLLTPRPPDA